MPSGDSQILLEAPRRNGVEPYFHLAAPNSLDALETGVHDYVHYYNLERIKLGLQGLSPIEYRLRSSA